eukprot:1853185-Pleurochrysis_carterae.AAC.1
MRPNQGRNQARPMPPTTISPAWRKTFTTTPLRQCDRLLQLRGLRASWDGAYVYVRHPKSTFNYPPGPENSA